MSKAGVVAGTAAVLLSAALLVPSQRGLEQIKEHEGTRLVAYKDATGTPTICTGNIRGVYIGLRETPRGCEKRLQEDAGEAGAVVAKYVTHRLTQRQYDALVSLVYNIGGTAFRKSTLLVALNAGQCQRVVSEFKRWVYSKGVKLKGLVIRRNKEAQEFSSGCSLWP